MTLSSPKVPPPNSITMGVGISTYEFERGHQHSVHNGLYQHQIEHSVSWHIVEFHSRVTNKTGTLQLALATPLGVSGTVLSSWLLFGMVRYTNSFPVASTENKKGSSVSQGEGESWDISIHVKKEKCCELAI